LRTPEQALRTFTLPRGYRIELVAAEPLVHDPVAIDFDADGRLYVVEMSGYMPSVSGAGEDVPNGRIVVLEDMNDDGVMDRRTVFLDSLVLPRTVAVLERGVLVGAPPFLWLMRDTTGDLRADTRVVVRDDYGRADANPEHNANSALWGIDNWIHSANDTKELRVRADGTFETRATPSLGQWGVSSDEYGRLYRNSNEDPLRTDHLPAHYAVRLGASSGMRGVYWPLTANVPVWPAHKTPAINRGYRERTMRRDDSTLAHYTSAGSPVAYTGDRYPADMRNTVFVTEPAGNLIGQFTIDDRGGAIAAARRARDSTDFLISTDERFRPVNLANAPDGTLYVVDMYRGIIQHRTFITDYLEQKISERGLEQPVGYGRIYRILHRSQKRGPTPRLFTASSPELAATLAHANGWHRITAQRMLVERRDTSVAAALRTMLGHADDRARLHAFWTLDGLGAADAAVVLRALADASPHVRAAAVRVGETLIERGDTVVAAAVVTRGIDPSLLVRRQVAASLVAFSPAARNSLIATMLDRGVTDDISAELIARMSGGHASELLQRAITSTTRDNGDVVLEALAAAIGRGGIGPAVRAALALADDDARPRGHRVALMNGLTRGSAESREVLAIAARPAVLLALAHGRDSVLARAAQRLEARLRWPGKPRPPAMRPLTESETVRIAAGRQEFGKTCAGCHQPDGAGAPGIAVSLVGSAYVNGSPLRLIRILLHGKEGAMLMPPIGATLSDEQIASILSYIRREWGNTGDPIDAGQVKEIRGATTGRKRAWTSEELDRINR
jgi:mono/diheme cytochrome c family protein